MEVHFYVYAIATDIVKQGAQLTKSNPAGHDALSTSQYLFIQVIPFWTTALRFTNTRSPLDGIQFVDFKESIKVVHGAYTVEVVKGIVYLLTLFADERLYEATVVIDANHC